MSGSPAFDSREWLRAITAFPKLPDLLKTVRQLEKRLEKLERFGESLAMIDESNDGRPPAAYLQRDLPRKSGCPRAYRILSEYLEPLSHFRDEKIQDTIVFFGSARITEDGPLSEYYRDCRTLARMITEWSSKYEAPFHRFVICSGGGPGIMEAANQGANDAGGKTIGLNIGLPFRAATQSLHHPSLSFEFHYFFMRKFWFAYLATARWRNLSRRIRHHGRTVSKS